VPWCLVVPRSSEIVRAEGEVTRLGRGKGVEAAVAGVMHGETRARHTGWGEGVRA